METLKQQELLEASYTCGSPEKADAQRRLYSNLPEAFNSLIQDEKVCKLILKHKRPCLIIWQTELLEDIEIVEEFHYSLSYSPPDAAPDCKTLRMLTVFTNVAMVLQYLENLYHWRYLGYQDKTNEM